MKSMTCDLCDYEAQGETFGDWLTALKPHYAEVHAAVMNDKSHLSPEQQKEEMMQWMEDNKARFEAL